MNNIFDLGIDINIGPGGQGDLLPAAGKLAALQIDGERMSACLNISMASSNNYYIEA